MHLKNLQIVNFKSWDQAEFTFSPNLNCFVGPNGCGKTNLLDAVHYLSVCKSYFNAIDSQNIKDGNEFFVVEGDFVRNEGEEHVYCGVKRGEKKLFSRNKKAYKRLSEHIGRFPSVIISPYDRDLITDGSELRRKFMDAVISQSDAVYLDDLMQYNKALQQRNALLKYFAANNLFERSSLEIYNEQMQEKGMRIHEKRREFLADLVPKLSQFYNSISSGSETPDINYASQLNDVSLKELLESFLQQDLRNQYSGAGVHRDDLEFLIDGKKVKKFGSQGQQKSFLIALKLAQYEFLHLKQGVKPVLLLDDIFDKLDEKRVSELVRLVHDQSFGQIFITDTHPERTARLVKAVDEESMVFNFESTPIEEE